MITISDSPALPMGPPIFATNTLAQHILAGQGSGPHPCYGISSPLLSKTARGSAGGVVLEAQK